MSTKPRELKRKTRSRLECVNATVEHDGNGTRLKSNCETISAAMKKEKNSVEVSSFPKKNRAVNRYSACELRIFPHPYKQRVKMNMSTPSLVELLTPLKDVQAVEQENFRDIV